MDVEVIGMGVELVCVVPEEHIGPELARDLHQPFENDLLILVAERIGSGIVRGFGHTGVAVAEADDFLISDDPGCLVEFGAANRWQV